ncbi:MAG: hypothetical protein CM15mP84_00570 [Cellvibrionales bacterium]|nr:MAG: hypothetical protein CM15mP84_00570 [Cellvibrionales bacterium]
MFLNGLDVSENGQAMSAFEEVGPGKHFLCLGAYSGQLSRPPSIDPPWQTTTATKQWFAEGKPDAAQRQHVETNVGRVLFQSWIRY